MRRFGSFILAWLLCGAAAPGFAQGVQTGTIRGVVHDDQALAVPGVTVTVTSPALQGPRSAVTDTEGAYTFLTLPPGDYTIRFELSGFGTVERRTAVPLGLVVVQDVTMKPAGVAETIQVVAETPAPIATPIVGANFKHDEVEALAMSRTLAGIAELSPALTNVTPNAGQVSINGAFSFDNVFMLNGVDVNDNLFGSPQNLFIEDAIQETQTLTSGIGAEYGRFSGGVVNAISKSGGNRFSGSGRLNLTNPSWSTETPFEVTNGTKHKDILSKSYEGTFGGPIARDRLWFFSAGRWATTNSATTFPETGLDNTQTDKNKRGEIKLTGTAANNHTIQGGYLNNSTEQSSRPTFGFSIDPFTIGNRTLPNSFYYTNYRAVLTSTLLVEAQYSQRKFGFRNSGGSSTSIVDSPIITLDTGRHYNAQYFDASDPENRNNRQLTANMTYFWQRAGRHEIKGGYEFFRSQRTGGNSQSPTNYVFDADYLKDAAGKPVYDSTNHLIPLFVAGETQIENWLPIRGSELNVDNNSLYLRDHWAVNTHWSADVGLRYERVRTKATGDLIGIDTDTIVPRLAAAYDVQGNGKYVAHVTYGHYSGRYNEAQIGANTTVGNPNGIFGTYEGPAGQGRNFAAGFNPANYSIDNGQFPTANVFLEKGLSSPITKEFTVSLGSEVGRRGFVEGTYVWRRTGNIIEDFITLANGTTHVVQNGVDFGTFTNVVYRNTDLAKREYQAGVLQSRYSLTNRWSVAGNYTIMFKDDGNYEGEAANQPGATSRIGDYPEIFNAARHFPEGTLADFQRHKMRIWSVYTLGLGRAGDVSVSGLWRVQSGGTLGDRYSLRATNQGLSATQRALLRAAGYPDAPTSQTIYFSARGSEPFKGFGVLDSSINYNIPVFVTLKPWLKFDVFNLFNDQKLIAWNRTVRADPASPLDSLGLRTGYVKGANFGKAESNSNFPSGLVGDGGRTFRVAFGFRF